MVHGTIYGVFIFKKRFWALRNKSFVFSHFFSNQKLVWCSIFNIQTLNIKLNPTLKFECRISNIKLNQIWMLDFIDIRHSNLNVGFSLLFDIRDSNLNIGFSLIFDIRHSKFESWMLNMERQTNFGCSYFSSNKVHIYSLEISSGSRCLNLGISLRSSVYHVRIQRGGQGYNRVP